jgi:glycosyltransferase involved in cell wall biosynthesis
MSGTARSQTLTVVIPTLKAAELLPDCLESVAWADEIIVVDTPTDDGTDAVCRRYPQCRLLECDGYIHAKVNHGFDAATSDWVMHLDADERVTPELARELQAILSDPPDDVTGYELGQRFVMLGRELHHGIGAGSSRQRMFRRGRARFPVRHEHEAFETSGRWLRTTHAYLHYNYRSVGQYLEKIQYYTDRDVERLELPARAPSLREAIVATLRPFYLYYLRRRGYRDGWVGFVDAAMRSVYQLVFWAKVRERWERERGETRGC